MNPIAQHLSLGIKITRSPFLLNITKNLVFFGSKPTVFHKKRLVGLQNIQVLIKGEKVLSDGHPLQTCLFVSPSQKYDFEAKQIWLFPSYSNFILPKVLLSNNLNKVQQGYASHSSPSSFLWMKVSLWLGHTAKVNHFNLSRK